MPVSQEEANQLRGIRTVLEEEVKRVEDGNDVRGVYDRVLIYLNPRAEIGLDIAKDCWRGYPQPSSDLHRE